MRRAAILAALLALAAAPLTAQGPYWRLSWQAIPSPMVQPTCDAGDEGAWFYDLGGGAVLQCQAGQLAAHQVSEPGPEGPQGPAGPQGDPGPGASPCDAWPVDSVFISFSATNPATSLGCGTWTATGTGRVLLGIDAGQTEFDTVGETGGAKTHTLTVAEMPSHTHTQDAHGHGVTDPQHSHVENQNSATTGGLIGWAARDTSTNTSSATGYSTASAATGITVNGATATNQSTGGDEPHSNLQPYLVVHMWRRTA